MKYIEVDEELYRYIAGKTERIGESASDIIRRLLGLSVEPVVQTTPLAVSEPSLEKVTPVVGVPASAPLNDFNTFMDDNALSQQKGAVGRFLFMLESLHARVPEQFAQVLHIQGRGRLYFGQSKQALLEASPSANPKEIGQSGFWVTTNNNTAKKRTILSEVLVQFGCDAGTAEQLAAKI
ncbi:replication initiation negative regulator SeqA [Shewanella salipaludis]|uniref:Negative modulator of initiation of replication n=1 Tax=Shewanella salipaludis TaxID=2723052 RepID=A0A972FRG7_9GAMM|nr:replication initiation negative regulator SeqA [Shewanella salipaludis]NMH63919.1 replication initiation negative regulator SeqA [Shewanella salipaludis]